jgi:F-type H+-transporting ATPase subunit a
MTALTGALAAARPGFQHSLGTPQEIFQGKCIIGHGTLCVNRESLLLFLVFVVLSVVLIAATSRTKLVPSGLQNVVESIYEFIRRDVVIGVMGPDGERYGPYLVSLFLFAFAASLIEVIPLLQFPTTSRMAVPAMLALISWGIYNWAGIKAHGFGGYLKSIAFPPGVRPKAIYILVTPIELVAALFLRPVTLAIRLFANFFAGHLLLVVAFVGTAYLVASPGIVKAFFVVSLLGGIVGVALEIFIAAVQAYVFALLTAAYIRLASAEEH